MADRRHPTAKRRFERRNDPPPEVSGKEYQALKAVSLGFGGTAKMRSLLVSKGLITSPYASAQTTDAGDAVLERAASRDMTRYEAWYRKFGGVPRVGCWG